MTSIPADADIASIGEAIAKYPSDRIKGVTLASLIRSAARGINIRAIVGIPAGPGALTKFAGTYLGQFVQQLDRATLPAEESDVVFLKVVAAPHVPALLHDEPHFTESCWSVFVRPSSQKKLVLLSEHGDVKLVIRDPKEVGDAGNMRVISGVTQDEFKAISNEYLANAADHGLPRELATELGNAATYTRFVELLKGAGRDQFIKWSKYRRDKIRGLFSSRMESLGLGYEVQKELLTQLDTSQIDAKKLTQERRDSPPQNTSIDQKIASAGSLDVEFYARNMLKLVIDNMALEEIRNLQIPFGRVLDAIKIAGRGKNN